MDARSNCRILCNKQAAYIRLTGVAKRKQGDGAKSLFCKQFYVLNKQLYNKPIYKVNRKYIHLIIAVTSPVLSRERFYLIYINCCIRVCWIHFSHRCLRTVLFIKHFARSKQLTPFYLWHTGSHMYTLYGWKTGITNKRQTGGNSQTVKSHRSVTVTKAYAQWERGIYKLPLQERLFEAFPMFS